MSHTNHSELLEGRRLFSVVADVSPALAEPDVRLVVAPAKREPRGTPSIPNSQDLLRLLKVIAAQPTPIGQGVARLLSNDRFTAFFHS